MILLDHSSTMDDFELIGNLKGIATLFSCRLIWPAGSTSNAYPSIGITVPSIGELMLPSGAALSLNYISKIDIENLED